MENYLETVPKLQVIGGTLKILNLSKNKKMKESPDDYEDLTVLQNLNAHWTCLPLPNSSWVQDTLEEAILYSNFIGDKIISKSVLSKYTKLQTLHLMFNSLQEFPYARLLGGTLKYLHLSLNKFSTFPNVSYLYSLETLVLRDSLHMNNISDGSFIGMNKLADLDLESNELVKFPDLTGLEGSLQILTINNNKISVLPPERLANMSKLVNLDLRNNLLVSILDLSYVGLTSIQVGMKSTSHYLPFDINTAEINVLNIAIRIMCLLNIVQ